MRQVDKDIMVQCADLLRSPDHIPAFPAAMFYNKIAREPVYDRIKCLSSPPFWHIAHPGFSCDEAMSAGSACMKLVPNE